MPLVLVGGLLAACHPAEPGGTVSFVTGRLNYTQTRSGTNSRLTVRTEGQAAFVVNDGAGITAGEGCSQLDAHRVRCSHGTNPQIRLELGDGDDIATIATDATTAYQFGHIIGGAGQDRLTGGFGNDVLFDDTDELDADTFDGGPSQSGSFDVVSYAAVTSSGVSVFLDDIANDGRAGENDNALGIEGLFGSQGPDALTGNAQRNVLIGESGSDLLRGLGGNDDLFGGAGFDSLDGGTEHDVCYPGAESATVINCEMVI